MQHDTSLYRHVADLHHPRLTRFQHLLHRYGRRTVFCAGMLFLSIWTVANGFATSFIQLAIFRALQGIGAAATVPSSVGIISSYFVAKDRTRGLSMFGAAGAVGFCVGLIFGGFLTSTLG
jgi:MFS family permease